MDAQQVGVTEAEALGEDAELSQPDAASSSFPLSSPGFWDEAAKIISPAAASAAASAIRMSSMAQGSARPGEATAASLAVPLDAETPDAETPTRKRRVRFGGGGDDSRSLSPPLSKIGPEERDDAGPSKRARYAEPSHATSLSYLPNRADPYSGIDGSAHSYLTGAEYAPNSFGDIGDYMRKKEIKVQTQNRDIAMSDPSAAGLPQIFTGLSFYINGNTHPPMEELRKMILQRGGEVRPVLRSKGMVKYIIAPMLTQMKFKQFQNYKVVKEGWITESCAQGKLLDWTKWKLTVIGGWEEEGRKGMEGFLKPSQAVQSTQAAPATPRVAATAQARLHQSPVPTPVLPKLAGDVKTSTSAGSTDQGHSLAAEARSPAGTIAPAVTPAQDGKALAPVGPEEAGGSGATTPQSETPTRLSSRSIVTRASPMIPISPGAAPVIASEKDKVPPKVHRPEGAFEFYSTKESNDDAARLLKDQEWRLKNTAERGNEGGFIDGYYQNSRLHHLSTWKAELRVLVAAAQRQSEENSLITPSHSGISPLSLSSAALPRSNVPQQGVSGVGGEKIIFHVDFDCFFVSCGLATRPHLRGKPAVVCHSQGGRMEGSTSEIASASYEARAKGVKNGMSLGRARTLVGEDLQTIPYEFETYKKFSLSFYTVLMGYADELQAVSVDEALIDATSAVAARAIAPEEAVDSVEELEGDTGAAVEDIDDAHDEGGQRDSKPKKRDPAVEIAEKIRDEVRRDTGCEVSIGISHNILLAKLATRRAKPAGVFHLLAADVPAFLAPLDVEDFPSVGYSIRGRMEEKFGTTTVGELTHLSRGNIRAALGPKTGDMVWGYIRGADERQIEPSKERKSISAEMNYGIRFRNQEQAEICVKDLAAEVSKRMKNVNAKGRLMTLKLLKRHPDAPIEPPKFLGHGWCETFNKSSPVLTKGGGSTDDPNIMGNEAIKLLRLMKLDPVELRGVGIQITKLDAEKGEREAGQGTLSFGTGAKKGVEDDADGAKAELKAEMDTEESARSQRHADLTTEERASRSSRVESVVTLPRNPPSLGHNADAGPGPSSRRSLAPTASSDGIDPDFLAALPEDLQREVKVEYARTRAAKKAAVAVPPIPAPRAPLVRPPPPQSAATQPSGTGTWRNRPPEPAAPPPARIVVRPTSNKHAAAHISKQLRPKIKTQLKAGQIADLALYTAWNKADAANKDASKEREPSVTRSRRESIDTAISEGHAGEDDNDDVVDLTGSPEGLGREQKRRRSVSTDRGTPIIEVDEPDDGAKIGLYFVRDLRLLGIDPEVFAALPEDMQKEAVGEERRKARQRKLLHRPADLSRQRARDRESERKLGLGKNTGGKGRTSRTESLSPTRGRGDSRARSTSAAPAVPRFSIAARTAAPASRPSLLNAQELPDVLNTIERWIASRGQKGPAERDSKKVEAYLLRLVDADQGLGGVEMAVECLKWMRLVLVERHGSQKTGGSESEQAVSAAAKEWWVTWDRFKGNVSRSVRKVLGAPLKL